MALLYFIGLNIVDSLLTIMALWLGGIEVNPVVHLFSLELGLPRAMLVKVAFAMSLGGVLWQRRRLRLLTMLNYVMVGVVINNMIMITYGL